MISTKELQATINNEVATLIVEKLASHLQTRMAEQWNSVVFELVSTRKSNMQLEKTVTELVKSLKHIENYISTLQRQTLKTHELQAKEEKVLNFLIREFGIKPEGE